MLCFWLVWSGLFCLCFYACLRSFTDWCTAHRQQSREQKKLYNGMSNGRKSCHAVVNQRRRPTNDWFFKATITRGCFGGHDEASLLAFEALRGSPRPARGQALDAKRTVEVPLCGHASCQFLNLISGAMMKQFLVARNPSII